MFQGIAEELGWMGMNFYPYPMGIKKGWMGRTRIYDVGCFQSVCVCFFFFIWNSDFSWMNRGLIGSGFSSSFTDPHSSAWRWIGKKWSPFICYTLTFERKKTKSNQWRELKLSISIRHLPLFYQILLGSQHVTLLWKIKICLCLTSALPMGFPPWHSRIQTDYYLIVS